MKITSKTGLRPSASKKINKTSPKLQEVQLCAIARPAPFVLKPFAGIYNPYPYGCSHLCNHPTDFEARELLRKAKSNWGVIDGKNLLLPEEVEAIRAGLSQLSPNRYNIIDLIEDGAGNDSVPEELFRRYTETDSRPLTPAPTLASAATKASGSRRCVTPDPINQIKEKTQLVLDLRRSHSQETLSYYGNASYPQDMLPLTPLIKIHHISESNDELYSPEKNGNDSLKNKSISSAPAAVAPTVEEKEQLKVQESEDEEEFVKRRGKRRRKKGRDASRGPPPFQVSADPETQVAAIASGNDPESTRPGSENCDQENADKFDKKGNKVQSRKMSWEFDSFLTVEILKQLRRELNEEVVDSEFNLKRKLALEEALKTLSKDRKISEELQKLQKELNVPQFNEELILSLPRSFTRSSARFELPICSQYLIGMTPLQYLENHVYISDTRKLLYNCIFNKFRNEIEADEKYDRKISGSNLQAALDVMMGREFNENQKEYIQQLVDWKNENLYDFKIFCSICALCERILAAEFSPQINDRKEDPPDRIEIADFEALPRKLKGRNVDSRLVEILNKIKTS